MGIVILVCDGCDAFFGVNADITYSAEFRPICNQCCARDYDYDEYLYCDECGQNVNEGCGCE